nr:hypothetical protein SHINE37_43528 [Rhizobiaceae bacterium]
MACRQLLRPLPFSPRSSPEPLPRRTDTRGNAANIHAYQAACQTIIEAFRPPRNRATLVLYAASRGKGGTGMSPVKSLAPCLPPRHAGGLVLQTR